MAASPHAEVVAYEFEKSRAETIRARLKTHNGKRYADIRTFYWAEPADGEEELAPTKKGVTVAVELLPELKKAVDALCDAAGLTER
jgi:hypothetical protein